MKNFSVALYCQGTDYNQIESTNRKLKTQIDALKRPNLEFTTIYYYDIIPNNDAKNNTVCSARPMFQKLLRDIQISKKYHFVAIPTLDILGETLNDLKDILDKFYNQGVEILPINDPYFKINNNIEKTLFQNSENRIKVPFGYVIQKTQIVPLVDLKNVQNKPLKNRLPGNIVEWIFKNFLNLKSYSKITKILNDKKVPSPLQSIKKKQGKSAGHSLWNRQQVKNILSNTFYLGGRINNQYYKSLISKTLWVNTQQTIEKIKRN